MSQKKWKKYNPHSESHESQRNNSLIGNREWYCQGCRKKGDKDDIVFHYRYEGNNLIICADCSANDMEKFRQRLQSS